MNEEQEVRNMVLRLDCLKVAADMAHMPSANIIDVVAEAAKYYNFVSGGTTNGENTNTEDANADA